MAVELCKIHCLRLRGKRQSRIFAPMKQQLPVMIFFLTVLDLVLLWSNKLTCSFSFAGFHTHTHKFSPWNHSRSQRVSSTVVSFFLPSHSYITISPRVTVANNFHTSVGRMTRTSNENEKVVDEDKAVFNLDEVDSNGLPDEIFDVVDANAPPIALIMKELLGINIFTFVLVSLIAFFFLVNALLGPGWLGQKLGIDGTGTFTEISKAFPSIVNLDNVENLL